MSRQHWPEPTLSWHPHVTGEDPEARVERGDPRPLTTNRFLTKRLTQFGSPGHFLKLHVLTSDFRHMFMGI